MFRLPLCLVSSAVLLACSTRKAPQPGEAAAARAPATLSTQLASSPQRASIEQPNVMVSANLPWLLFGGGSEPLSNQVSLAQDMELLSSLLAGRGLVLFASGPGALLAVQRASAPAEGGDVRLQLARLFGLPDTDRTDYRPTSMAIDGPSTSEHVKSALARALSRGEEPLLVYAACHGAPGEQIRDNSLSLWGGWPLTVQELAGLLDQAEGKRPTRFVITACFGGGFADLLFVGGNPERGLRGDDHCGLFAAPADDEASGCDPNPDRREQESYSLHLLHALSGKDRKEQDRRRDIDLDQDGHVSLLEAHTWARIASRSFDVPTTSSERFLRHALPPSTRAALNPLAAPEDVVVVRALGDELELPDEASAQRKLAELNAIFAESAALVDEAQKAADDSFYALRIALLERYPLLEHFWEARTGELLAREAGAILAILNDSELSAAHRQAEAELAEALAQHDALRVVRARVLRLTRAYETLRLASALYKRGGAHRARYERLRACERWVPKLR